MAAKSLSLHPPPIVSAVVIQLEENLFKKMAARGEIEGLQ